MRRSSQSGRWRGARRHELLIDECLSEELAKRAHALEHVESAHLRWIGMSGAKDWELLPVILAGDWTFVTENSVDFRGPAAAPGSKGEYSKAAIHAGLICLNGPVGMDLGIQLELFEAAFGVFSEDDELINQVLEATLDDAEAAEIRIVRYALPRD
jgi:hypothetical protein